jgi:hypothetical protein
MNRKAKLIVGQLSFGIPIATPTRDTAAIHVLAAAAATMARRAAFSLLAREHHGVTAKNRDIISTQVDMAARHAKEEAYLANGYTKCPNNCGRLVTPSPKDHPRPWLLCPTCERRS